MLLLLCGVRPYIGYVMLAKPLNLGGCGCDSIQRQDEDQDATCNTEIL